MRLFQILAAVGIGFCMAAGAAHAQATWQNSEPTDSPSQYYLRLSGSNTIGSDLAPALVRAWLIQVGVQDVAVSQRQREGHFIPEKVVAATLNGKPIQIEIKAHGSATGFVDLDAGANDIAMSSRAIKPDEVAKLARFGNMMKSASEHVIGLDGIAIVVPQTSPLATLSRQNLKDIFAGRIVNWSQLGGPNLPVAIYARDDNSGTFDTFKALVLEGEALSPTARRFEDSEALDKAVSRDSGGIGFVALPYVKYTRAIAISDGAARALEPTVFTIKNENYALTRRLYLYTPGMPENPHVAEFIRFALSDEGQKVVTATKFVGLQLSDASVPAPPVHREDCLLSNQWPDDRNYYCSLRQKAQKIETTFRFRSGATGFDERSIDNRGEEDMHRILAQMQTMPNKKIILAGFADSRGNYQRNCEISLERALAVAYALEQKGLPRPITVGFCSEIPVRDNSTPNGREFNRRVEIYLADSNIFEGLTQPRAPQRTRTPSGHRPHEPVPPKPVCTFHDKLIGQCSD